MVKPLENKKNMEAHGLVQMMFQINGEKFVKTLPETNSSPLKIQHFDGKKQGKIGFSGAFAVSFREGKLSRSDRGTKFRKWVIRLVMLDLPRQLSSIYQHS